jgi:tRNA(Ile)-lysidine synthase
MLTSLHRRVLTAIRSHGLFHAGDCAGIAVSGGGDSMALLFLMNDLRLELGLRLAVLHFNHRLRGAESDADEEFTVGVAARELSLPFYREAQDMVTVAPGKSRNIEEAARQLRYDFFERVAAAGQVTRVATAHTLDDQAETVLGRILRGTGVAGLGAIREIRGLVVRPLLGVGRDELREFLVSRGLRWREDATNLDETRLRARLRHSLLPLLARDYASGVSVRLAELARLVQGEERFWGGLVEGCFSTHVRSGRDSISMDARDLLVPLGAKEGSFAAQSDAQHALAGRLVTRIIQALAPSSRLSARQINKVLGLASSGESNDRIQLPDGVLARREFEQIHFSRCAQAEPGETKRSPTAYEYNVELPNRGATSVSVMELGKRYSLKLIDWPPSQGDTIDSPLEVLDAERLRSLLVLRNWWPGDAYRPIGRRAARKVKVMFLAARIPQADRPSWPVLTSGGKVAWVKGMPAAEEFAAGPKSAVGLVIQEESL